MSWGMIRKIFCETWLQLLAFGIGVLLFEALLSLLLPQLEGLLNQVLEALPFARVFMQALLGTEVGDEISSQSLRAIVWVHPTILALLWAQEIVFCTRVPAGEIDRGTIDVLLSWPVSRRGLFCCEAVVWLVSGLWMMVMLYVGHRLAGWFAPPSEPFPQQRVFVVLSNLYCVYIAVGGVAWLVSSVSDRRGRAVAAVFVLVLAPFLLNFLVQAWPAAEWLAPLNVLHYYRPARIIAGSGWPLGHMAVLLAVGVGSWLTALETFARRSICTL